MIVSAMVPGLGTTLKYFRKNNQIILEAANQDYDPIKLNQEEVTIKESYLQCGEGCRNFILVL